MEILKLRIINNKKIFQKNMCKPYIQNIIVLPIFRQGLTSINSEQERGGSRLGLTLFRPCT